MGARVTNEVGGATAQEKNKKVKKDLRRVDGDVVGEYFSEVRKIKMRLGERPVAGSRLLVEQRGANQGTKVLVEVVRENRRKHRVVGEFGDKSWFGCLRLALRLGRCWSFLGFAARWLRRQRAYRRCEEQQHCHQGVHPANNQTGLLHVCFSIQVQNSYQKPLKPNEGVLFVEQGSD